MSDFRDETGSPGPPTAVRAAADSEAEALVLEKFLFAPRFTYTPSRFLPELSARLLHRYWRVRRRLANVLCERDLDTVADVVTVEHFHPDRVWYQPSGWSFLRVGLRGVAIGPDDVFVDFGCGKGRVLYQAAQYPFRRVVGVEISEELAAIARANLARHRRTLTCGEIEVVVSDVLAFTIPDDMSVAYFYDPFVGETFRRVIDEIVASIDRSPRKVTIVYAIPIMRDYIESTGRFRLRSTARVVHERGVERVATYESC